MRTFFPKPPDSPALTPKASVAPDAELSNVTLGRWTEVGTRCLLNNVQVGDYSYIQNDCDLMLAEVGRFVSIASHVRINPSNHPWWRPTLHHFTYRASWYFDGEADDQEFFDWRAGQGITIGHDTWIGHGAVVHGAHVGRNCLVGMNAVLMDRVVLGEGCIVGALAFLPADSVWGPRQVIVGNPAKAVKDVSDEMLAWKTDGTKLYQALPAELHRGLHPCEPLREMPADLPQDLKSVYRTWKEAQGD